MSDRTTFQKNLDDRTFRIRLKSTPQEIDVSKNKNFVKVIEHEYACRYLEKLNIEPNPKNIQFILKKYPIKNCDIKSEWNNNNFSADTIVISTRKKDAEENQPAQNDQHAGNNLFEELGLKLMKIPVKADSKAAQGDASTTKDKEKENSNNNNNGSSSINSHNLNKNKGNNAANSSINNNNNQASNSNTPSNKAGFEDSQSHFELNYDIDYIKKTYVFPFNQSTIRKMNQNMQENPKYISSPEEKDFIFTSHIFKYPFSQIRIDSDDLQELQRPINSTIEDILFILDDFKQKFPKDAFPMTLTPSNPAKDPSGGGGTTSSEKKLLHSQTEQTLSRSSQQQQQQQQQQSQQQQQLWQSQYDGEMQGEDGAEGVDSRKRRKLLDTAQRAISFDRQQIDGMLNVLGSPIMAKLLGLFAHFAYWNILGEINVKSIDSGMNKQIFIQMQEHLTQLKQKQGNNKIWLNITMPMVILTLKMMTEHIYKNRYPMFFKEEGRSLNNQGTVAMDKMYFLCDSVFDETHINGRFTFWESHFKSESKLGSSTQNDRKLLKKRIYATSLNMNLLMDNPQSSQARNILAKSHKLLPMIHGTKKDQLGVVKEEAETENVSAKEKLDNSNKLRLSHLVINKLNAKSKHFTR